MKKIFLLFAAAVAALSSCVDEKAITPVEKENMVTINAVSADTKTVFDGTAVVWENEDAIKLVFKGDNYYTTEFTTELEENSTEATFAGILDPTVTVDVYGEKGFAVYPSSVEVESDGQIEFVIPSNQNGEVTTGSNLSYSEISLASLNANGTTDATFQNALSLLKITVPQGVKSVTVASETPLAGTAPFYFDAEKATLAINEEKWYDSDRLYSVTLAGAEETLDNTKTYFVHVFPGVHESLTISVEGNDCSYSKNVDAQYNFEASKYYGLNIANIFSLVSGEFAVSPLGGEVEVRVVTTVDDYTVNVPAEATWLTFVPPTKGEFRKDVLVFTATENTTSAERTATVTVTSGDKTLAEFSISQKNYVADLLGEYLESYSKSGMASTGTLKIELSDDFSKGLYKVTICESVFYADYENGKLSIHDGKYTRTLNVSEDFSKLENTQFSLGYSTISGYIAIKPLGAAVLTDTEKALVGVYNETWTHQSHQPAVNGMEITASDEAAYGQLKVKFFTTTDGSSFIAYAALEDSKLKVAVGGMNHPKFGTIWDPAAVIEFTVEADGTLTLDQWTDGNWKSMTYYVATKFVEEEGDDEGDGSAVTPEALVGSWNESFTAGDNHESDQMTITLSDDASKGQLKVKMFNYESSGSVYFLECYADLSADGTTLTVKSNGVKYGSASWAGNFVEDLVMTVSADGSTITYSGQTALSDYTPVGSLVATKN